MLATMVIRDLLSENFDCGSPWNIRGDDYLTPSQSSGGSEAATVTYPWLDMTVASDSTYHSMQNTILVASQ